MVLHCELPFGGIGLISGISALSMCASTTISLANYTRAFAIQLAQGSLFLSGIGGFIYHSTLNESWQLAEAIPLFLSHTCITSSYITCMRDNAEWRPFIYGSTCAYLLIGLIVQIMQPLYWWWVQLLSMIPLTTSLALSRNCDRMGQQDMIIVRKWINRTSVASVAGYVVWCIDTWACTEWVAVLQPHALWHCTTAYELYCMLYIASYLEARRSSQSLVAFLDVELPIPYQLMGTVPSFTPSII
jgi:hypothetical protein